MLGEKLEMNLELETDKGPMRTKNVCGMMGTPYTSITGKFLMNKSLASDDLYIFMQMPSIFWPTDLHSVCIVSKNIV
jgi:hypothetical protein